MTAILQGVFLKPVKKAQAQFSCPGGCPFGYLCVAGLCVAPTPTPECDMLKSCPPGRMCVGGVCVVPTAVPPTPIPTVCTWGSWSSWGACTDTSTGAVISCGHTAMQYQSRSDTCGNTQQNSQYCELPACVNVNNCHEYVNPNTNSHTGSVDFSASAGNDGSGTIKSILPPSNCVFNWGDGTTSSPVGCIGSSSMTHDYSSTAPWGGDHTVSYTITQGGTNPTSVSSCTLCLSSYPNVPSLNSPSDKNIYTSRTSIPLQWGWSAMPMSEKRYGDHSGWGYSCPTPAHTYRVYLRKGGADFDNSMVGNQVYNSTYKILDNSTSTSLSYANLEWGTWYYWGVEAYNGTLSSINNPYLSVTQPVRSFKVDYPKGWFVTYGGDVHGENSINSPKQQDNSGACAAFPPPPPATNTNKYFSKMNNTSGPIAFAEYFSGLVSTAGTYDFGCTYDSNPSLRFISEGSGLNDVYNYHYSTGGLSNLKANNMYFGYDYYHESINRWQPFVPITPGQITNGEINAGGVGPIFEFYDGNLAIDHPGHAGQINVGGSKKRIYLVNGNLDINIPVRINSAFLAFIVKGNINISPNLQGSVGHPDLRGVYIADGSIYTGSKNRPVGGTPPSETQPNCSQNSNYEDKTLYAVGTFVSWSNIIMERDLSPKCKDVSGEFEQQNDNNITTPAEVFYHDPSSYLHAPFEMGKPEVKWREIAP